VNRDPRIDSYIERAQPFAQPILRHVRERVHALVPEGQETLKWSMPSFTLEGKILLSMAAFKAHATVSFWRGSELGLERPGDSMGQLGRLAAIEDLPPDFDALVRKAAELTTSAPPPRRPKPAAKPSPMMHPALAAALDKAPKAKAALDGFPPSAQRDYLNWIAEAKQDSTREKRIATAIEWLSEGKRRHWKYEKC
jgi:uncharacterized protein YdeI (YjbR/CyaY-like superfamily)